MNMPNFQNIEYQRPSLDNFRDCVLRVRLRIMTAHSSSVVENSLAEFQKELSHFETCSALCSIRHDLDTKDHFYAKEMAFYEEADGMVAELSTGIYTALLNSEIAEELKDDFGHMIFLKAANRKETISKEVLELLAQEAALENEYEQILAQGTVFYDEQEYPLSMMAPFFELSDRSQRRAAQEAVANYFTLNMHQLDQIFDQLVNIRTNIAQKLGYENFIELGYKRMERYDYSAQDVAAFRDFVVSNIVPVTVEIRRLQQERLDVDILKYYDLPVFFASGNPTPAISVDEFPLAASKMFQSIFGKDPSFYDVLHTHQFTDLKARKNKTTGAYCSTLLDYGIPFIFMNATGTADDIATLIHESGHAYAAIRSVDSSMFLECLSPTMETCEIHSTAMEFLAYPYLERFFGDRGDSFRSLHMTKALLFLPYGCLVDEFQHLVYENPLLSTADRHQLWRQLEKKYQPDLHYDQIPFYENGGAWHKKSHIFTSPFYYIDYCLAQVVALEIWDMSRINPKKALQAYDQLCMEGGNGTFLELLKSAGLSSPFSSDVLKRVVYQACNFLDL